MQRVPARYSMPKGGRHIERMYLSISARAACLPKFSGMLNSLNSTQAEGNLVSARILDGNKIRDQIKAELSEQIRDLKAVGVTPGLAAVLVGQNPASQIYVRSKVKTCEGLGIYSEKIELPADITTERLLAQVESLNMREEIDGILVQLPLPSQVDTKRVLMAVDPAKDVDGFHPVSVGNLVAGRVGLVPCTPAGIIEILLRSKIPIQGARAVVIGRSDIVGKPVAMLLLHNHATVTICHSKTRDLPGVAREGDILVAAMGKPAFVTRDFIKPGATVIDVGMNRLTTAEEVGRIYRDLTKPLEMLQAKGQVLVGDVHPEEVKEIAGAYTPVPGGVGPLTIAMLMANTVQAARLRRGMRVAAPQ
jgi:methylenetetrahydrofolate dehydrogenase (NADP+)/methenyltetrahydrofolate cyclohydrolase